MPGQQFASHLGACLGMIGGDRWAPTVLAPASHVVEQCCRTHDLQVSALNLGQVLGQSQHPQHVIKVVDSVRAFVLSSSFFDGDQGSPSSCVIIPHHHGSQGIVCSLRLPSAALLPDLAIRQEQAAVYQLYHTSTAYAPPSHRFASPRQRWADENLQRRPS
jgi:hypothetical protein